MSLRREHDDYILASGRRVYAHAGILGIDEGGDVWEGYDGDVEMATYRANWAECFPDDPPPLTDAERAEIAQEMVRRWIAWGWPAAALQAGYRAEFIAKISTPGYCALCDLGRSHTCTGGK